MDKIGKAEAIGTVVIIMITHIIINLPQTLMQNTGSSTALNVIYISLIALMFVWILSKLFSLFPGKDIFDIAEFLAGKWLKITLQILFIAYLIGMVSLVLRVFTLNLKIIYFANLDISTILLVFLIAAVIVNHFGFRTVIKNNFVFLPIILTIMLILFLSTLITTGGLEHFLPILGYGFEKTFLSGISNLFAFCGLDILFLIIPHLKDFHDFKKVSLISVGISSIYLFLAVIASMFLLPSNSNFEPIFSVYLAARRISLGTFLERLDPIFILIWILSIFSYLSIWLFFISDIFKKATHIKESSPLVYCFATLIFTISLTIANIGQIMQILSTFYQYIPLLFTFGLCFAILVLAAIKKIFFKGTQQEVSVESNL